MEEQSKTKVCPLCAEVINTAAKVCPHCRSWQRKWSLQNPQVAGSLWMAACFAALVGLGVFFDKLFGPKEQFGDYRTDIIVLNSQFSQRISGSNLWITVVGTVTNRGNLAWKGVGVEAQFLDASGRLIDAIPAADYHGTMLLPHSEAAFKIEGKASQPLTNYTTHKTFVRWAKDGNVWL